MLMIKRYPNRKFYDTEGKSYITLDEIADRIRKGREIQVIDNASGDDITTVVLTQIILEQEKKQVGFVPRSVLTGLVQAGGFTIGRMRRALANPLELLKQIDEEIERRIVDLINRGELAEDEANSLREKLLSGDVESRDTTQLDENAIKEVLELDGVPTRKDLQALSQQLEDLVEMLEDLETKEE
jgi:polyhydroxyalkanoate synthesis repressor PhaR